MENNSILDRFSTDPSKIMQNEAGILFREVPSAAIRQIIKLQDWLLYDHISGNKIFLKPACFHIGPSCWSSAQVEDYFKLLEQMFLELAKNGFTLNDGHPWNFVFEDSIIKFTDFGSFIPFTEKNKNASLNEALEFKCLIKFYRTSYMKSLRMYLAECNASKTRHSLAVILELGFKGLHENDCYINLLERFNRITDSTYQPKSTWLRYRDEKEDLDSKALKDPRFAVANELIKSSGASKVIDIGSNDGLYSIIAAGVHGMSALALEIEDVNSSWLHRFAKENCLRITSATCSLEDYVYHLKFTSQPFRPVIDLAMLFAVFHHMVHDGRYTVNKLVDELEFLGVRKMILEYISYDDVFLSLKTRVLWYNLENIILSFEELGYQSKVYPEHAKGRRLVYINKICGQQECSTN